MKKSQSMGLLAMIILFIAQFLNFGANTLYSVVPEDGKIFENSYSISHTGWEIHPWWAGIIMGILAVMFWIKPQPIGSYVLGVVLFIVFGLGDGQGGYLSFAGLIILCYGIKLKMKENKEKAKKSIP